MMGWYHDGMGWGGWIIMTVAMVARMVCVWILVIAFFAVKNQKVHAERVKRRDEHPGQHRKVCKTCRRKLTEVNSLNDAVLGVEPREQRCADQCQRAKQRGNPGNGHVLAQSTHVSDVLVVMHADDDGASTQEQQRFEKGVRHEVENCDRIS